MWARVDFNERRYFWLGFAFSGLSGVESCNTRGALGVLSWHCDNSPGSICAAAAQVRAVQITLGSHQWSFCCLFSSLLACGSNLELTPVTAERC